MTMAARSSLRACSSLRRVAVLLRAVRRGGPHAGPSSALLVTQGVLSVRRLLSAAVDALEDVPGEEHDAVPTNDDAEAGARDDVDASSDGGAADCGEGRATVSRRRAGGACVAQWLFASLAFVEEPLVDTVQYDLQRLRRACRKSIVAAARRGEEEGGGGGGRGHRGGEKGGEKGHPLLDRATASLLLVLVMEVFGQR